MANRGSESRPVLAPGPHWRVDLKPPADSSGSVLAAGRGDRDAPGPANWGPRANRDGARGPGSSDSGSESPCRRVIAMARRPAGPLGGHAPTIIIKLEKFETSNPGPRRSGASGPGMWADRGDALKLL